MKKEAAVPYERIGRTLVSPGAILDYYQDDIRTPDGKVAKWDFIDHKGAAAVLPVLEDGRILMVRQYRNALERETLEIPAGGLQDKNEPMRRAAIRELKEETGYRAGKLKLLLRIHTTVAFCNERIDIFLATALKPGKQRLDEEEYLNVETHSLEELIRLIYAGKLQDSKTVSALLAYQNLLNGPE